MEQNNKTPLYKRLLAIAGIVILLGLYVNLFIKAITGSPDTFQTFINCAAATVAVPIAIWVLIWATGVLLGRHTIASLDPLSSNKKHDKYGNVIPDGKIDTVVFDIGNVLADFSWREFLKDKGYSDEEVERIGKASVLSDDWNQIDLGILPIEEIIARFVENDPEIKEDLEKVYSDFKKIVTKRDNAIPWIKALKKAGYKVSKAFYAAVSKGTPVYELVKSGVYRYTTSRDTAKALKKKGYTYKGIVWQAEKA